MAAIRIGFVGLLPNGSWTAKAHFPYLQQTNKYCITALCNSTIAAAEASIKYFGLSCSVRAYGSYTELANEPTVDLVICSVRVDKHYDICRAAIQAGKDCWSEWPLGKDLSQAREMQALAIERGICTVIALPSRVNPFVNTIRRLVCDEKIGRVLSTTTFSCGGSVGAQDPVRLKCLNEKQYGGNLVTIFFAHWELGNFRSLLSIQRSSVDIIDPETLSTTTIPRTTYDQILVQGTLQSGGVISVHQRGGPPFKGSPGLIWRIQGELGQIEVTADGSFPHLGYKKMDIRIHDFESDNVTAVDWKAQESRSTQALHAPAADIGEIYEAFARGNSHTDWAEAVRRQEMIDEVFKSHELHQAGNYMKP